MAVPQLAFSFGIGFFYGIFVIDVVYSGHVMNYISEFDDKNKIVIRLESLKKIYMRASSIADLAFSFL